MKNLAVVILAAGKGKRMNNPNLSKVMALLAGKPLIQHVLQEVSHISPKFTYLIVGHQKESVINFVQNLDLPNTFFVEQVEQLGTGHAVDQTEPFLREFDGDVLILCGDVPLLKSSTMQSFIDKHYSESADVTVLSTYADLPKGYGRIIRDSNGKFQKITEEKDANDKEKLVNEINSGVYILKADLLFKSLKNVSNNNSQGEYYLTDIIDIINKSGKKVEAYAGAKFEELQGVNSPEDLERIEGYYNNK
jgi:UDP-N-acetylglucosamine diphosphorylase/glucosamine-1-phosphate N-acetyltransferase